MLDKRTFKNFINSIDNYVSNLHDLETSLNVMFDDNFLTRIIDNTLITLADSFFTDEQINDLEEQITIETVRDMIYHYAFVGEFGLKLGELQRLYVEDEGLPTEEAFNAGSPEELYDVIIRYLNPPKECQTYTIHC